MTAPARPHTITGYVIQHPDHPPDLGWSSFGQTVAEAWYRHCQWMPRGVTHAGDQAIERQRWTDKGYRPFPATLTIGDA